jgi:hypothetical protein
MKFPILFDADLLFGAHKSFDQLRAYGMRITTRGPSVCGLHFFKWIKLNTVVVIILEKFAVYKAETRSSSIYF